MLKGHGHGGVFAGCIVERAGALRIIETNLAFDRSRASNYFVRHDGVDFISKHL